MCSEPIMPAPGQEETVRIVALDRDFHVQCYRCEVCFQNCMCTGMSVAVFTSTDGGQWTVVAA